MRNATTRRQGSGQGHSTKLLFTLVAGMTLLVGVLYGQVRSGADSGERPEESTDSEVSVGREMPGVSQLDAAMVSKGRGLYEAQCQACHGPEGVGERPDDPSALDPSGLPYAPALDQSMHAWHHTDEGLVQTILQGSPRNPRMAAWGKTGLTADDARAIVEYMKSLWGPVGRLCQGPGHMDPNCIARATSLQ